jgi:hypothetical protein
MLPLPFVQTQCPKRSVQCRYCNASMQAAGVREHEGYCGARTAACALCGQKLLFNENEWHFRSIHPGVDVVPPSRELEAYLAPPRRDSGGSDVERAMSWAESDDGDDNDGAAWSCHACTYQNTSGRSKCEVCGAQKQKSLGGSRRPPLRGSASMPARPCRNAVCKNSASTTGTAAEYALCSRCFGNFAAEAPDQEELVNSLSRRYALQVRSALMPTLKFISRVALKHTHPSLLRV